MRHPASRRSLPHNLLLILTYISAPLVQAAPQVSPIKPLHSLVARITFPSYQLNPSTILWPPNCAAEDPKICLGSDAVEKCTIEYCSKKVALTCWTHVYAIDFECLCGSMSSSSCPSCASGINNQLYLAWLSQYCILASGWDGLPSDWNTNLPDFNILGIGGQVSSTGSNTIYYEAKNPFTSQFITDKHDFVANQLALPNCISSCDWMSAKWSSNSSIIDGNVAVGLAGILSSSYDVGGMPQTQSLYLDLNALCLGWSWSDLQSSCGGFCTTDTDNTGLLSWLKETCGGVAGFDGLPYDWQDDLFITNSLYLDSNSLTSPNCLSSSDCQLSLMESGCTSNRCSSIDENGNCNSVIAVSVDCFCPQLANCTGACTSDTDNTGLLEWLSNTCGNASDFSLPSDWQDSLYITNSTFIPSTDFVSWPSCIKNGKSSDCQLSETMSNCTSDRCDAVDSSGNCQSVSAISLGDFCSQVTYGTSCRTSCIRREERIQYLEWLNSTCYPVSLGASLPNNWTTLLSIQRSDMLPWTWQLVNLTPSANSAQCPSASRKLLAFAAVNIAMLILVPIIARRTVIKKLTCKYLGRQESSHWFYTAFVAVGLHLASNAVNAIIIKRTPGYEATSVKDLTLSWCTRPRLAWLVVALLPFEAEKSMYFSATASTLAGEVVLQLLGAYNMGMAANYARIQKFLMKSHLLGIGYARETRIMYIGAMLWLSAVTFAIAACIWSILGVSDRILRLSEYWIETRKLMKVNCAIAAANMDVLQAAKKIKPAGQGSWRQEVDDLQDDLPREIDTALDEWGELAERWTQMPTELRQQQKDRRTVKAKVAKARDRLDKARQGTQQWNQRAREVENLREEEGDLDRDWIAFPRSRQNTARAHLAKVQSWIAVAKPRQDEIAGLATTCRERLVPFEHAIADTKAKVDAEDNRLSRIKQRQRGMKRRWGKNPGVAAQLLNLDIELTTVLQQRAVYMQDLTARQNDRHLIRAREHAAAVQAVLDVSTALVGAYEALEQNWQVNEENWRSIYEKRMKEETKTNMRRYPFVVVLGMLLCWIAQWLWWAGYVGLAGDMYCPPKLPLLASIWTLFSATGSMFGASY